MYRHVYTLVYMHPVECTCLCICLHACLHICPKLFCLHPRKERVIVLPHVNDVARTAVLSLPPQTNSDQTKINDDGAQLARRNPLLLSATPRRYRRCRRCAPRTASPKVTGDLWLRRKAFWICGFRPVSRHVFRHGSSTLSIPISTKGAGGGIGIVSNKSGLGRMELNNFGVEVFGGYSATAPLGQQLSDS